MHHNSIGHYQYYRYSNNFCILTATADQDYTGLPTMFSFVTGQSLSCILIDIIDDNIAERKEILSLVLQPLDSSPGVRISRGQSIVEITDNDGGKFTFSRPHIKKCFFVPLHSILSGYLFEIAMANKT